MALLDTSVFVDLGGRGGKRKKSEAKEILRELLSAGEPLYLSRVNLAELYVGLELSNNREAEEAAIADFLSWVGVLELDDLAARHYGKIRAALQGRGQLVGDMDMLIGAIAMANGQAVVTRNLAHFQGIPGLNVIAYGK